MRAKVFEYIKNNIFYRCAFNLIEHEAIEYAGYLTYLNILSIFPFIFIIFTFISVFDETKIGIEFFSFILRHVPKYFLDTVGKQIQDIANGPPISLMNIALVGAIWTASSSIEALKTIFNRIYLVHDKASYIVSRLTSILQFMFIVLCVLATLTAFIIIPKILPVLPDIAHYQFFNGQFNIIILNITLLFIVSIMYYSLTSTKLQFFSTMPGAFLTVTVWNASSMSLSYYMTNFSGVSIMYGSLASIIITLIFLYIINLTLIYGAEFNRLLGSHPSVAISSAN